MEIRGGRAVAFGVGVCGLLTVWALADICGRVSGTGHSTRGSAGVFGSTEPPIRFEVSQIML
jgi:hypothetical protein